MELFYFTIKLTLDLDIIRSSHNFFTQYRLQIYLWNLRVILSRYRYANVEYRFPVAQHSIGEMKTKFGFA